MPADKIYESDTLLDLESSNPEDLGKEVEKAHSELTRLRMQLEDIEKEKERLENLKRRRQELEDGRAEMMDKLTRSLGTVQREMEDTQKRLEYLHAIQNSFTAHLRYIESINPRAWSTEDLPKELSKAISAIEDARADYLKAQARLAAETPAGDEPAGDAENFPAEERGFGYWLRSGLAFTFPLIVTLWVGLLLWAWSLLTHAPRP
ncbi:MAG: hypothetical protein N2322_06470 [Terrimicrobiaceae bacterium]|nr:hypothetical protein [Terrimicrobiaceae bacterium]